MMRIILASQGFTTDEIEKEISKIVGKSANEIDIAIINEAIYGILGDKSKRWLINELSNIEKHIGGRIDFVNFRVYSKREIESRLLNADLIYLVGGKQFEYSKLFNETDTVELIKNVAKQKVIMGTSAGAIVLGTQIQSKEFWNNRYNIDFEDIKYSELNLVPFNIIPHYLRDDHKQWTRDFLNETLANNPFPVYAIKDTQAIAYIDGKIEYIGGKPDIFGKIV